MGLGCAKPHAGIPSTPCPPPPPPPSAIAATGDHEEGQLQLWSLPLVLLRAICDHLSLRERARLLCCVCRQLLGLEPALLPLIDLSISLDNLRQAHSLSAWLERRRRRLGRLRLVLPHPDAWVESSSSVQRAPWLWQALSKSSASHITWDALAQARPAALVGTSLDVGFTYLPICLPSLEELVIKAPIVNLPACLSDPLDGLPALTRLSLTGEDLHLEPGCLPLSLRGLSVHWRCDGGPFWGERLPIELIQLAVAAINAPGVAPSIVGLSLAWETRPLCCDGLRFFSALTALRLAGVDLAPPGLPGQGLQELSALSQLRELEVHSLGSGLRGALTASVQGLSALGMLCTLSKLALSEVDLGHAGPTVAEAIWALPALKDLSLRPGLELSGWNWLPPIPKEAPLVTQLTRLALTVCEASASAAAMEVMKNLQQLVLHLGPNTTTQAGAVQLRRLAPTLDALPQLRLVVMEGAPDPGARPWNEEVVLELKERAQRRRGVKLVLNAP